MKRLLIVLCLAAPFGVLGMEEVDTIKIDKENFVAAYKVGKLDEAIDDYQKGYGFSVKPLVLQSFAQSIEKEVLASAQEICDEQIVATLDELDETIALVKVLIQASDDGFAKGICIFTALKDIKDKLKELEVYKGPTEEELKLAEQEKLANQKQYEVDKQGIIAAYCDGRDLAVQNFMMNYRNDLGQSSGLAKKVEYQEIANFRDELKDDVLDTTEAILKDSTSFTYDAIKANLALLVFIRLTNGPEFVKIQSLQHEVHDVLWEKRSKDV